MHSGKLPSIFENSSSKIIIASSSLKNLEYLDLECNPHKKKITSLDKHKLDCRFDNSFTHQLHSNNSHLNSLTDLFISFSTHLSTHNNAISTVLDTIKNSFQDTQRAIRDLIRNLDFIKNQNEQIIFEIKKVKNNNTNSEIKTLENKLQHCQSVLEEIKQIINS